MLRGEACRDAVADAIRVGYRHIDTVEIYGGAKRTSRSAAFEDFRRGIERCAGELTAPASDASAPARSAAMLFALRCGGEPGDLAGRIGCTAARARELLLFLVAFRDGQQCLEK